MNAKKRLKRQKKKKPSKIRIFVILLIIALFTTSVVELIYFFYSIKYVKVYDVVLRVEPNKIGLNVDVENARVNLGIVQPGGTVKREIIIVNNGTELLMGNVVARGELAKFLVIEKNFVLDNNNKPRSLSLIANIPSDARIGNYRGQVIIFFREV